MNAKIRTGLPSWLTSRQNNSTIGGVRLWKARIVGHVFDRHRFRIMAIIKVFPKFHGIHGNVLMCCVCRSHCGFSLIWILNSICNQVIKWGVFENRYCIGKKLIEGVFEKRWSYWIDYAGNIVKDRIIYRFPMSK